MPRSNKPNPLDISILTGLLLEQNARFGEPTRLLAAYTVDDVIIEFSMYRIVRETTEESDDEE